MTYLAASNTALSLMMQAQTVIQGSTLKHDRSYVIGYLLVMDFKTYFLLCKTQTFRMLLFVHIISSDLKRTRKVLHSLNLLREYIY